MTYISTDFIKTSLRKRIYEFIHYKLTHSSLKYLSNIINFHSFVNRAFYLKSIRVERLVSSSD